MREISILSVVAINTFITVRYSYLIWKRRIQPALAMWIFFTVAVGGSLATYMAQGRYSLLDNILNAADLVPVVIISVVIAVFGDKTTKFNKFDLGCLGAVALIVVFWLTTQSHAVSNLLIQALLVIAYFPVIKRLWRSNKNTESFAAWIGLMLAPIAALFSSQGTLATIYSVRAIVSAAVLLLLMIRAELRGIRDRGR